MKYSDNIYFCSNLEHKQNKILADIKRNKHKCSYFIIAIPPRNHQLELFRVILGQQHAFDIEDHTLIGVAKDYDSGIELIYRISQEVYSRLGAINYRKFFIK